LLFLTHPPTVSDGPHKEYTMPLSAGASLRLALPKGRMQDAVVRLLADAGIDLRSGARGYRPTLSLPGFETKVLKPQNIVEMLHLGSRDVGFAGADWVAELDAELVELLDTGLDPVRIVAAAPTTLLVDGRLPSDRPLVVASEYERLTRAWIGRAGLNATVVRSFGATEVFPPEDADCIVDNTASGATLEANGLAIVDELMRSSTRLYAHPRSLDDPARRAALDSLVLLLRSVLEARTRVMLEVNVARAQLEALVAILPCMREPTIAPLHGDIGFAVKAAVPRRELPVLIPRIKAVGGTDIVVSALSQLVP
jgi:ATP phosphoribosyltransferase